MYGRGRAVKYLNLAWSACLRCVVGVILYVATRVRWTVEIRGLEHDTRAPRTFLAITHKRDLDAMAPVSRLMLHRGLRAIARDVHFAMRADAFTRGFLARVVTRPRWLAFLLRPLALRGILVGLGIHPTQDIHLRPAEEWIREAMAAVGDVRAGEALAPEFVRALAVASGEPVARIENKPLSRLLAWRYHDALVPYHGPEMLVGDARRRAERRVVARVKAYIENIAAWLWAGGTLYSAPEGKISPDGRLSPVAGGYHRLMRLAPPDTRVVPIAVTYDHMTARRPHAFVDLAPAIEAAPTLARAELDARLRRGWLRSARFTCTMLSSGFLVRAARAGEVSFTRDEMARAIRTQAATLIADGRHVDSRLIRLGSARGLVAGYLAFAERRGLVRRLRRDRWSAGPLDLDFQALPGEAGFVRAPLAHAWNELQEMLSAGAEAGVEAAASLRASQ
jgi:hypothetical protein